MRRRAFGRFGFEVSEVALGTWGLSGDPYGLIRADMRDKVIERAVEHGINLFETADVYGQGEMETLLGEMLDPASTYVVTKIGLCRQVEPPQKRFDRDSLRAAFDGSQERLNRDKLDVVLLHCPSVTALEAGDCATTMRELVEEGRLSHWGVSAGSPEVVGAAVDAGAEVVELAYNLMLASDLHEVADSIAATETALLARSVLAHGLLAGYWRPDRTFPSSDHRDKRWDQEQLRYRVEQLSAFRPLLGEEVPSLRALALRFVLANHLVSSAVLGPRTLLQLDQLIRELGDSPLSESILQELPLRFAAVGLQP